MRIEVLTLFPGLFGPFLAEGLMGRARENGLVETGLTHLREFGMGRHRVVDDIPYGGGAGMVLKPEPVFGAARRIAQGLNEQGLKPHYILVTPQGVPFNQAKARQLAGRQEALVFICGRYEGFDERIRQGLADEEISGGDFICLGGEVIAMAIMEAVIRLIPGVLGNPESTLHESFSAGGLEYPQYTRPPEFEGMGVPQVLLSGNHQAIARWREAQTLERTRLKRPELLSTPLETFHPLGKQG
ncbi:MAG: tRNA (guanosine(37)-N1)-methyltransferase TrmD [Deltaproteobacteria bacterium]|nr:tRNA (guanosine(37)-N1)-methyltransferase TrmD [Deltaproteobacteria bacterium]